MEILGIGPMELLLILIIALMIFGPDRLPEIGAKLGHALREMRQVTRQFSQEIEETRQALEAPIEEARAPLDELTQPLQDAKQAVESISQAATNPAELIRKSVMRELSVEDPGPGGEKADEAQDAAPAAAAAAGESKISTDPGTGPVTGPDAAAAPSYPDLPGTLADEGQPIGAEVEDLDGSRNGAGHGAAAAPAAGEVVDPGHEAAAAPAASPVAPEE